MSLRYRWPSRSLPDAEHSAYRRPSACRIPARGLLLALCCIFESASKGRLRGFEFRLRTRQPRTTLNVLKRHVADRLVATKIVSGRGRRARRGEGQGQGGGK